MVGLGQEIHKTSLEHLVEPESQEVKHLTLIGSRIKENRNQVKELPVAKGRTT